MISATSVNSVTELVKDAVKSVVGSGSEAEASLIPSHDHVSKDPMVDGNLRNDRQ